MLAREEEWGREGTVRESGMDMYTLGNEGTASKPLEHQGIPKL